MHCACARLSSVTCPTVQPFFPQYLINGTIFEKKKEAIIKYKICNMILNSVRQHNQFITKGNYKVTCFDYKLVILRPILSIVAQDAMHTLGSRRVYIHGIHHLKSFVSKGVTVRRYIIGLCYFCLFCLLYCRIWWFYNYGSYDFPVTTAGTAGNSVTMETWP